MTFMESHYQRFYFLSLGSSFRQDMMIQHISTSGFSLATSKVCRLANIFGMIIDLFFMFFSFMFQNV